MSLSYPEIGSQDIDHLGIVAGIIDEIGIEAEINQLIGTHSLQVVSPGQVVKAMILNGLGFVSAPLYLFEQFFSGKATETLIGEGVKAEHLNDSRLGRVLDALYQANVTEVFLRIALRAFHKFSVQSESMHLDATSFHLHGTYKTSETPASSGDAGEEVSPQAIHITYGYSRDHRPDLKQFVTDLICSGDGGVPCYLKVADGNEVDQAVFAGILKDFREQWTMDVKVYVADAALYSADNVAALQDIPWVSRVPGTLKEAKQLLQADSHESMQPSGIKGYKFLTQTSQYGGVPQRWLVIASEARRQADLQQWDKRLQQQFETQSKALAALSRRDFACETDARQAAAQFGQQLKYHTLEALQVVEYRQYAQAGRPRKHSAAAQLSYRIQAHLVENPEVIQRQVNQAGRFILATNIMDAEAWSPHRVLQEYKHQQCAERGFRFLKDPLFFASSIFLKLPQRIMALALIMALCLLVYTLGERKLRQALLQAQETIPNQLRQPTQTPTLRWVFQGFQAVHLIWIDGRIYISNLTQERKRILRFLGSACEKYYLLC